MPTRIASRHLQARRHAAQRACNPRSRPETARANAQTFADQCAALVGGASTATTVMTTDTFASTALGTLPPFTIAVRARRPAYSARRRARVRVCRPAPLGPNRSIVNLAQARRVVSVGHRAHEMGHAYWHGPCRRPRRAGRNSVSLMNPSVASGG